MSRAFGGVPKSDVTTSGNWQVCMKLFVLAGSANCSDAHDRVYGLLGVLQACLGKDVNEIISVDYSTPAESLFTEFTALVLVKAERLELLGALNYQILTDPNVLPSWVVDFRRQSNTPYDIVQLSTVRTATSIDLFRMDSATATPAADSQGFSAPFHIHGSRLHVFGAYYDTIARTISLGKSFDGLNLLKELADLLPTHVSGRRRLNTIARTLICNIIDHEMPSDLDVEWLFLLGLCMKEMTRVILQQGPNEEIIETFSEIVGQYDCCEPLSPQAYVEMLNVASRFTASSFSQCAAQGQFPDGSKADATSIEAVKAAYLSSFSWLQESAFRYAYARLIHNNGNNLIVTKRGLLGTCPMRGQAGDEIWILRGSDVPFVLRPMGNGGEYCFIGSIFMLDVMDGGALRERPQLKDELREITIV